jgi:glycosyltransferase involved in cell wall biosynthesis
MIKDVRPKLFIGMPVYNCENYISSALDSILKQDFEDWQLLISDNCSTDNTGKISLQYASIDSRISYIKQDNNIGAANNFLFLLKRAKSQFFMWAAADDEWSKNYVSECINLLNKNSDIHFASGKVINTDKYGKQIRVYNSFSIFCSKLPYQRMFQYLMAKEIDGKANIIYSVYRTEFCKSLSRIPNVLEGWGSDMAFVFAGLARGNYQFAEKAELYKRVLTESDISTAVNLANKRYDLTQYHGNFPPDYFHEYITSLIISAPTFFIKLLVRAVMYIRYALCRYRESTILGS